MKFFQRKLYEYTRQEVESFSDSPVPTFWSKWFGGATVPLLLTGYAVKCWILKQATLPGRHGQSMQIYGEDAIMLGFVCLFIGLFLHFHFFWTALPRLGLFSHSAKILSLLGLVVSIFWLLHSLFSGAFA